MPRSVNWLRALSIAGVGVATFYSAVEISRASKTETADVVLPVVPSKAPSPAITPLTPASGTLAVAPAPASAALLATPAPPPAFGVDPSARARSVPSTEGGTFRALSWLPPPPPPPPPAPPPPPPKAAPPAPPPSPYTFVGMVEQTAGKRQAFLSRGDTLLIVSAGDVLDNNTYRVESLGSNEVVLTYLPLNMQQTLRVSETSK